jgi:hypothetical protein
VEPIKKCKKCGEEKPVSVFPNAGRGKTKARCRSCLAIERNAFYAANKDEKNRKRREYTARPEVAAKIRAHKSTPEYKARAKEALKRSRGRPGALERRREKKRENRRTTSFRANYLWDAAKLRAKKKGLPLTITKDWVEGKLSAGHCEVSGLPFDMSESWSKTRRCPMAPSIDQIEPGLGYTENNCRMVLTCVNLALCDWGLDFYLSIARAVLEKNSRTVHLEQGLANDDEARLFGPDRKVS